MAATSSSPRAEPWALPVFWALGAGQAMIVRSTIRLGWSVDALGLLQRAVERRHVLLVASAVVGPVDDLHVPAVGLVALRDILGQRDVGVVLDRDLVLVVDERQVAELLGAGDGRRLGGDALLDVAVAGQAVDPVVEDRLAVGAAFGSSRPCWRRAAIAMPTALPMPWPRGRWWSRRRPCGRTRGGPGSCCPTYAGTAGPRSPVPTRRGRAGCRGSGSSGRRRGRTGHGPASRGRRGCGASPSGTAGRPPARGSSRSPGGRCRPSAPRPSPGPVPCRRLGRRDRSSRVLSQGSSPCRWGGSGRARLRCEPTHPWR